MRYLMRCLLHRMLLSAVPTVLIDAYDDPHAYMHAHTHARMHASAHKHAQVRTSKSAHTHTQACVDTPHQKFQVDEVVEPERRLPIDDQHAPRQHREQVPAGGLCNGPKPRSVQQSAATAGAMLKQGRPARESWAAGEGDHDRSERRRLPRPL